MEDFAIVGNISIVSVDSAVTVEVCVEWGLQENFDAIPKLESGSAVDDGGEGQNKDCCAEHGGGGCVLMVDDELSEQKTRKR